VLNVLLILAPPTLAPVVKLLVQRCRVSQIKTLGLFGETLSITDTRDSNKR